MLLLWRSLLFLLFLIFLGIGVDDMFVLLSGLASTSTNDDIETRIGETMKHSGISITITSVTDIVAFCVGSKSIFPSVQYFSYFTGKITSSKGISYSIVPKMSQVSKINLYICIFI